VNSRTASSRFVIPQIPMTVPVSARGPNRAFLESNGFSKDLPRNAMSVWAGPIADLSIPSRSGRSTTLVVTFTRKKKNGCVAERHSGRVAIRLARSVRARGQLIYLP